MTKEEAFVEMLDMSRDVISPIVASGLVAPWTTLKKLGVKPRRLKNFRIIFRPEDAELWAYATSEVVEALALTMGAEQYYSRYEGDGMRHQDVTEHYVSFIKTKEPVESSLATG